MQPGNSGGAVVNDNGMVIGMAASTLDSIKGLEISGVVPQNVNYVIKSRHIVQMLEDCGIDFSCDAAVNDNVVDMVSNATVLIRAETMYWSLPIFDPLPIRTPFNSPNLLRSAGLSLPLRRISFASRTSFASR